MLSPWSTIHKLWVLTKMASSAKKNTKGKGKKPVVAIEDDDEENAQVNASWTLELNALACELFAKHLNVSLGQSGAIIGKKISWTPCVEEFKRRSNKPWGFDKLKNKYDWLKRNWHLWLQMMGESGLGWERELGTIDAPDEWWEEKIKENKKFARFKKYGFTEEMEKNMHIVFGKDIARGNLKFSTSGHATSSVAPSDRDMSGYIPQINDISPGDQSSYVNRMYDMNLGVEELGDHTGWVKDALGFNTYTQSQTWDSFPVDTTPTTSPVVTSNFNPRPSNSSSLGKRGSSSEDSGGCKKTRRMRQYDETASRLKSIDETIKMTNKRSEDTATFMRNMREEKAAEKAVKEQSSIAAAMDRLYNLEGVDFESKEFLFASSLVYDDKKREVFLRHKDSTAWNWVIFEYERSL